ncbi:hypothetical protein OPV22_008834 [Ensete ventricosum]|uniref:Uncharacterized protein n=1 Tax=Ensete ventricosum TaxID=4639 RepID=A0AAV8RD65_ENSVE|nr:hypothetical protein OPV22_008834 [Ensete ventricosum]
MVGETPDGDDANAIFFDSNSDIDDPWCFLPKGFWERTQSSRGTHAKDECDDASRGHKGDAMTGGGNGKDDDEYFKLELRNVKVGRNAT